jgi:ubiquinone/menaquinone biosynthesis C-methylase UbiE
MGPLRARGERVHSGVREEQLRPLYTAVVVALAPDPGTRLLHVGCGAGTALRIAALTGAEISGLDSCAPMLAMVRDRLPDADLRAADPAELPYDRGCFDQVMAFEAIQYAPCPMTVIAELARVTRPGGTVAIGLWHNWSGREASAFLSAIRDLTPLPSRSSMPVRDLYRLREVMVEAGLDVYSSAEITHRYDFASLDEAWLSMTDSPYVARAIELMGEDAAHETFLANFANRQLPDGSVQQDNLFQYALGRATS